MKWKFYNEDVNTKEVQKEEIEEFEAVLKQQIKNLSEISNNAIQSDFAFPDFERHQKDQDKFDINEFFYDWYTFCYSALLCMESFRASRLNYLHQTLERINYSYHNSRLLEFTFNFRHFIEVSASYDKHVIEIIKLSEKVSDYPKGNLNLKLQERKKLGMNLVDVNGDFIKNCLVPFYEKIAKIILPTTIGLHGKSGTFKDNEPLKAKKGEITSSLYPERIMKHLQHFEGKIKNLHPHYDLLSEFIHPNSYIFMSRISEPRTNQFIFSPKNQLDDEKETIVDFFIRTKSQKIIKDIVAEILKDDKKLFIEISNYRKSIKKIVNSTLGLTPFADFIASNNKYSSYICLCGSGKLLKSCCIKTSKKDLKLLKKRGLNLRK